MNHQWVSGCCIILLVVLPAWRRCHIKIGVSVSPIKGKRGDFWACQGGSGEKRRYQRFTCIYVVFKIFVCLFVCLFVCFEWMAIILNLIYLDPYKWGDWSMQQLFATGRWIDLDIFSTAALSLVPPTNRCSKIPMSRCSKHIKQQIYMWQLVAANIFFKISWNWSGFYIIIPLSRLNLQWQFGI